MTIAPMTDAVPREGVALYRLFDAEGVLLYVGISLSAFRRLSEHSQTKEWWPLVTTIRIERHPDRPAAEAAELEAIAYEGPLHNVAGRPELEDLTELSIDLAHLAPADVAVPGARAAGRRPHLALGLLVWPPFFGFGAWAALRSPVAFAIWTDISVVGSLVVLVATVALLIAAGFLRARFEF